MNYTFTQPDSLVITIPLFGEEDKAVDVNLLLLICWICDTNPVMKGHGICKQCNKEINEALPIDWDKIYEKEIHGS